MYVYNIKLNVNCNLKNTTSCIDKNFNSNFLIAVRIRQEERKQMEKLNLDRKKRPESFGDCKVSVSYASL